MDIVKLKNGFQLSVMIQEGFLNEKTGRKSNPKLTVKVISGGDTFSLVEGITLANLKHLQDALEQGVLAKAITQMVAMGDTTLAARERVAARFSAEEVQNAPAAKAPAKATKAPAKAKAKSTESVEPSLADILRKLDARMAQIEGRLDSQE